MGYVMMGLLLTTLLAITTGRDCEQPHEAKDVSTLQMGKAPGLILGGGDKEYHSKVKQVFEACVGMVNAAIAKDGKLSKEIEEKVSLASRISTLRSRQTQLKQQLTAIAKDEFETTAQFNARRSKIEVGIQSATTDLEESERSLSKCRDFSEDMLKIILSLKRQFKVILPLSDPKFDADLNTMTVKIKVDMGGSEISTEEKGAVENQINKETLVYAIVMAGRTIDEISISNIKNANEARKIKAALTESLTIHCCTKFIIGTEVKEDRFKRFSGTAIHEVHHSTFLIIHPSESDVVWVELDGFTRDEVKHLKFSFQGKQSKYSLPQR